MAISKDVDCAAFASFAGGTSVNLSMTGVASGASIVVFVAGTSSSATVPVFTVNDGNAYTQIVSKAFVASNKSQLSIFLLQNVSSGSKTITVSCNTICFARCWSTSFTGVGTYAAADTPVTANGNSTTPATGTSATLSRANMLIVTGFVGDLQNWGGSPTIPPATGYTNLYNNTTNASPPVAYAYKIVSATTAVSANIGTTTSDFWGAGLAMLPDAGSDTPLSVTENTITLSGQSVVTTATGDTLLSLTETVATFSGQAVNFLYEATWTEGYLVFSGQDLTLIANGDTPLVVTSVDMILTGSDVTVGGSFTLGVTEVVGVFTGQTITFLQQISVQPVTEGYLYLLGQDITILNSMSFPYTGSKISVVQISTSGKTQWVDYIPVKYITVANAKDINTWNLAGGLAVKTISGAGLVAWKDYKPVAIVGYPTSGANRFDSTGYIQVVEVS